MKFRLPLSLLFAVAVSAATGTEVTAASTSKNDTPPAAGALTPQTVFPQEPLLSKQWQWDAINIAPLWDDGIRGNGVVIGVIDQWVEPDHEDLKVSPYNPAEDWKTADLKDGLSYDFMGKPEGEPPYYTDENHGTFVSGMAAAIGGNDKGVVGAAPGATIAGLHVNLSDEQIAAAAWWGSGVSSAGVYTGDAAIQIKNCSFGGSFYQDFDNDFQKAITTASKNNVIFVFAAGNSRKDFILPANTGFSSEGNNSSIINVAATMSTGKHTAFSSFGSNIFIAAPGANVVSTDRTGEFGYNQGKLSTDSESGDDSTSTSTGTKVSNSNYASSDGTSFSAPLVSGVIALGKQVCAPMDVRWAKHALAFSSGHGDTPNIDWKYDENGKIVQASGPREIVEEDETEDGDTETSATITVKPKKTETTGNWNKNSAGYWFNNNYGFGNLDAKGFVDTVRDIAYTTVEEKVSTSDIKKQSGSSEIGGDTRKVSFDATVGNPGRSEKLSSTKIETVSVKVTFSEEARTLLNLGSLKITLSHGNDTSILVEPSTLIKQIVGAAAEGDEVKTWSYTFLSNAFWQTSLDGNDWKINIEYAGEKKLGADVDMTDFVTVESVDFTLGDYETERDKNVNGKINAHALVLDKASYYITGTGEFYVEDSIYIQGGALTVSGKIGEYEDSELKKGVKFVQTAGTTSFEKGSEATFARGMEIAGGDFSLNNAVISASAGMKIYGGNVTVSGVSGIGGNVDLYGGNMTLIKNSEFSSAVTVHGGSFVAQEKTQGGSLTVAGGYAQLNDRVDMASVIVGKTATGEGESDIGGVLEMSGKINVKSGVELSGTAYGSLSKSEKTNAILDGDLRVRGNAVFEFSGNASTVNGGITLGDNAKVRLSKEFTANTIAVNGGTLFASTQPATLKVREFSVGNGGTFAAGTTSIIDSPFKETGENQDTHTKVTFAEGSTLWMSARAGNDFDVLTIKENVSLEIADGAKVYYDFGNRIPYAAEFLRVENGATIKVKGELLTAETNAETDVTPEKLDALSAGTDDKTNVTTDIKTEKLDALSVNIGENAPRILSVRADENGVKKIVDESLVFRVEATTVKTTVKTTDEQTDQTKQTTTLSLATDQLLENHTLRYAYQTERQIAVQNTLLWNESAARTFLASVDEFDLVSDVLAAYDQLGTPVNAIALDELHDKQASAITGALSRRARELRSGFVHSDAWSNPLFGNAGFSYSAKPTLVAATGFVPYLTAEDDFPLMIWLNGGFSFSEADEAVAISSSKSRMFNVEMGADFSVCDELALGAFIGHTSGRTKFDESTAKSEIQSRNIGVYATGSVSDAIGSFYYTALAAIGFEEYDFKRTLSVGGLNASANADPKGWQGIGFIEAGYEWKMEKFSMGPSVSLRYVSNNVDDYTETSSESWMRLDVDSVSYDSLQTSVGWRAAYRADFETVSLMPELRAAWNHEFLGTDEDFDARLALPHAESYTNTITSGGDDYATLGAGLTIMLGEVSTLSLDYDVQLFRDNADPTHMINAIFRTRF